MSKDSKQKLLFAGTWGLVLTFICQAVADTVGCKVCGVT